MKHYYCVTILVRKPDFEKIKSNILKYSIKIKESKYYKFIFKNYLIAKKQIFKYVKKLKILNKRGLRKLSDNNFLKIIKDSGLSHDDVLALLEKEGKIKTPQTYAEFYKIEEAKRLAIEKAEKEKKDKATTPPETPETPAEPPATPPAEPPTPPKVEISDEKLKGLEAKMTKLINDKTKIPLATPSEGEETDKAKEPDYSLGTEPKYGKYI